MLNSSVRATVLGAVFLLPVTATMANGIAAPAQIGVRPFYLVDTMKDGDLKTALQSCETGPFHATDFSIGHRGAPLQFPEHTRQSYTAAAQMGAGVIECDVAFTKDRELVCRHDQCDLHTTTDILARPELANKCSVPFDPANPGTTQCCTSDLTLDEFLSLNGKMDAANNDADTVADYMNATPSWRTDLYAPGTVISHKQSIALIDGFGRKFTPELKTPQVEMPFEGDYTQEIYAQQLVDEYKQAGIDPSRVYLQSFRLEDILYWIENEPEFARQAVYLDDRYDLEGFDYLDPTTYDHSMQELADMGVRIIAPPIWMLLTLDADGNIVPSVYAEQAKAAGLDIITWSLERDAPLHNGGGWYHTGITDAIAIDGDVLEVLDVLAKKVGVIGVFSDWPATATFYANCMLDS